MNNSTRPAIPPFYDNSKVISPWCKVPERLPDFDMPVWTATEEGRIYEAVLRVISSNEMAWIDNRGLTIEEKVFYWCPKNNGIEKPKAPQGRAIISGSATQSALYEVEHKPKQW